MPAGSVIGSVILAARSTSASLCIPRPRRYHRELTLERAGGVVVSEREHIVVQAKVGSG